MTIKRFGNWCFVTHGHEMMEADKGDYVLFKDHERELTAAQAKLARIEQAGKELPWKPDRPNFEQNNMPDDVAAYLDNLRVYAIAQQVRADENERDAEGTRLALKRLNLAVAALGKIKDGKTLFEHSPSKDEDCFLAWAELNKAQHIAKIVVDAALNDQAKPTGKGM